MLRDLSKLIDLVHDCLEFFSFFSPLPTRPPPSFPADDATKPSTHQQILTEVDTLAKGLWPARALDAFQLHRCQIRTGPLGEGTESHRGHSHANPHPLQITTSNVTS